MGKLQEAGCEQGRMPEGWPWQKRNSPLWGGRGGLTVKGETQPQLVDKRPGMGKDLYVTVSSKFYFP